MEVRNPSKNKHGTFDCEVNHPTFGWMPYTTDPNDSVEFSRALHAAVLAGEHGEIAEYTPRVISDEVIQLRRRLAYADAHTGSDRLFAEAQRMQAMQEQGYEEVRAAAVARYAEIKTEIPYGLTE